VSNIIIHLTIDNYLELVERSKKAGIKEGESMQTVLDEMIKEGKITTVIKTERNKKDILKDVQKHWKVLDMRGFKDEKID
jgi:putative heme iron utilization protein